MSKDGLCAIVTGSASGLGAATAAILAKGGARIVVNYSNSKTEAEATADLCRTAGADVVVVQGDVSRDEDCKKIAAAAAPFGRLDILVNNAGTTKHVPHGDLDRLSAEDHPTFKVRHRPVFLGPLEDGQDDVGMLGRLVEEQVGDDQEVEILDPFFDPSRLGRGDDHVRAEHQQPF